MKDRRHQYSHSVVQSTPLPASSQASGTRAFAQLALASSVSISSTLLCATSVQAQDITPLSGNPEHSSAESKVQEETEGLPSITVLGKGGEVTDAYAGGQVAAGGRLGLLGNKGFMDTPFSTIGYTDDFIADRQAEDITDVIAATDPAVFTSGVAGQNLESYSIRGFRSDIGDVTIDGLAGMAPYYRSSPEMFERIEVLKGPSALLNGMPPKGSVGGAVNLVPKRADEAPLTQLTARYMSDSQLGGHVDVGRRFGTNNQFGVRFNGVHRDGETSVNEQDSRVQMASLGLDWRSERARVFADLYTSDEHVNGPTRGITLAPGVSLPKPPKSDTLLNPSWAFNDTQDKGAMFRAELDVSDQLMLYAAGGVSETDFKSTSASVAQVMNAEGDIRTNMGDVADAVERRSGEVGMRSQFMTGSIGHELAVNATHYSEDYALNARRGVLDEDWLTNIYNPVWGPASDVFDAPAITQTDVRLTSVGLADTLAFADGRVQMTLGVRHQNVKQDTFFGPDRVPMSEYDESAVTPAAALLFRATDRLSLYANYTEGLSQGASAPVTAENVGEVFEPYKTRQKEAGLKLDLGEFAHTVSVYEITRPSSYTDPVTNVFSFGGEQRNRGLEWSFFGSPLDDVRLMGGIAYLDPELTKTAGGVNQGKQATGLPKWQAKLGAEWDLEAVQGLTLTGNLTSISKQYLSADNTLSVPGYTLVDLGARYRTQLGERSLTWRLSVNNLTNKTYWAKPHYSTLGLGAPRTVMLSATMGF